jgi:drug/metabolite transporter (DMT)-like permease
MLVLLGIVTCVSPYFLYTLAMRDLSAGTASSLGIIEPMAATVFSAVFLSEIPDLFQIIGIILILGATVLLSFAESRVSQKTDNKGDNL